VIAHPQLQRHGALNRVSANDETKRVSALVVKHPRDRRQTVALACAPEHLAAQWLADLGERGRLGEPRSKPSLLRGGLVNRLKRGCLRAPCISVGHTRAVMPHGGSGERFVCEPVPRGPEALFTFGRGPVVASRHRLAAELTSSLPKLARRNALLLAGNGAPLLSVFTIKTRARATQSRTRPASHTPLQGGVENRGSRELAPPTLADGKP
jgi:hypothetical protein